MTLEHLDHLDHLHRITLDVATIADVLERGPSDAPVAGCPGWSVSDLCAHLGEVHRWVIGAVTTGGPPVDDPDADPAPVADRARAEWLRAGARRLVDLLGSTPPEAPTWHPFPVEPKLAGLWPRRQAQEALVHRWDAEYAVGRSARIERGWAVDGIDEYWTVMLPRLIIRERLSVPSSALTVRLTDSDLAWHVDGASGAVRLVDGSASSATIEGSAESVLLRLWGRPVAVDAVAVEGDTTVAEAWLTLGGA
jgi:uncharacterized protein (TIGR03083 family)